MKKHVYLLTIFLFSILFFNACIKPEVVTESQDTSTEFSDTEGDSIPEFEWGGDGTGTGGGH